jgi:hypothetical protein
MGRALDVRINRRRGGRTSPSASTDLSIIEAAKLLATSGLGAMKLCEIPRDVGQLGATSFLRAPPLRRSRVIHRFLWVPLLRVTVPREILPPDLIYV